MKNKLIIILILITFIAGISPFKVSADVMGTSVSVIASEVDIKRVEIGQSGRGGLDTSISLNNISDSQKDVDKVVLTVTKLDGSLVFADTLGVDEALNSGVDTILDYEFPGSVEPGEYVGSIELYSSGTLLGQSKALVSISESTPQVLGAATQSRELSPVLILGISIPVLILGIILLLKNIKFLHKRLSLTIYDIVAIITFINAFAFGVFGSYLTANTFFPSNDSVSVVDPKIAIITGSLAILSVVGIGVLLSKRSWMVDDFSLRLQHLILILVSLSALAVGFGGGYFISGNII